MEPDNTDQPERRKNISFIDSLITIVTIALLAYGLVKMHPDFCILIGITFSFILAAIFQTRVGRWIISVIYSAIWALLGGAVANSLSSGDLIWSWAGFAVVFIISLMKHRYSNNTKAQ